MTRMKESARQAARLLNKARKAVALTGAGVSVESGIPDFRSREGLWSRYDPMEYGTIGAFRNDPAKVWEMLAELLFVVEAEPNAGHFALARLEEAGILKGIITQNIDLLHQKAGSRNVVEYHGSIAVFHCLDCGREYDLAHVKDRRVPPDCSRCHSLLKPGVVFFDEQIPVQALAESARLLAGADVLLVAGTSCQVVPASLIPSRVHAQGGRIMEINPDPALEGLADVVLAAPFAEAMAKIAEQCLKE